jgi:hypothetical protein
MGATKRVLKANAGYARPIALALSRPALTAAALRLVVEALRSFFLPQFQNVFFHRRPTVNVDDPLDASVPFDPRYVKKYLQFVRLWIGSFYTIWRLYGDGAIPGLVAYIDAIRSLYADAGKVYKRVHTTTTRPSRNYNLRFAIIHAVDPHLNCIPSLHVLVVAANWMLAESFVKELGSPPRRGPGFHGRRGFDASQRGFDASLWIEELRSEALAITESVLFVKQHSVNCIGVSLYCLGRFYPHFEGKRGEAFVRDLFADGLGTAQGLAPELGEKLRRRMREVRDELEGAFASHPERGWRAPVLEFIKSCS